MPGLGALLRIALTILSGVGVAEVMDKFLPSKAPNYQPVSPGLKPAKLLYFVAAFTGGALVWRFVNRKFHILARRHSPKRRRTKKRR